MKANKMIQISEQNYDMLKKLGVMGDTFDDVITKLLSLVGAGATK